MLFASAAKAEILTCYVCGVPILGHFYWIEDKVDGQTKRICPACEAIQSRCYLCGMPVVDGFKRLPDGRFICARDLKTVVESDEEAKEICHGVKDDLDRLLSRYLTYPPDNNIVLSLVDKYHLDNLFSAPGNESSCVSVYGATSTHTLPGQKFVHTVDILSCLQKPRLMAVCAHEYTHTWMNENLSQQRRINLNKNTVEGFCELVAYIYMDSLHEDAEVANIKRNNYTVGQILVLIEAYDKYGFNTVMEWMKNGEDTTLTADNLDRVRILKDGVAPLTFAAPALVYGTAPAVAPTNLVLKSISGSGQHRFAMINSTTFETMERGKVRVGQTNVTVRCVEIRGDSVTIQVDDSPDKKQLFLRNTP